MGRMPNLRKCPICSSGEAESLYKNYPGFIEGAEYEIFSCKKCNTNFILAEEIKSALYEIIYSEKNTIGYDRYLNYAKEIVKRPNPLKYLAESESTYYPVYKFLKGKTGLSILEIGCGYGYLTYAITKAGFNVKGIDISESAIAFAKKNLGMNYFVSDLKTFSDITKEKFDLIISTEVIEHLTDQVDFIRNCKTLLNPGGKILITTPNKNYYSENSVWQTDLPPVHTIWLSNESFLSIAEQLNLNCEIVDFSDYFPQFENRLVKFIRSRRETIQIPVLTARGTLNEARTKVEFSLQHRVLWKVLHKFAPVRFLGNLVYNAVNGKEITLGVVLSNK
jgi:ubiquinone biosynthesis O-methyltransferase